MARTGTVAHLMSCSNGWFVTGYYTPGEVEFSGPPVQIDVANVGPAYFPADFLRNVRIEGWGLTKGNWFLGWDGRWIKAPAALDARGKPLQIGSLAVDTRVIPLGTSVTIPSLLAPWNQRTFTASDTGGGIIGNHVDVYCGAGPAAKRETFRITGDGNRLCLG
jgi:hypothetical protein